MYMGTGVQRCAYVCTLSFLIQRARAIPAWLPYLFPTAKMCRQGAPGTSDRPSLQPKPAAWTSKQYLSAKVGHGTLDIPPLTTMLCWAKKMRQTYSSSLLSIPFGIPNKPCLDANFRCFNKGQQH